MEAAMWRETVSGFLGEGARPQMEQAEQLVALGLERGYDSSSCAKLEDILHDARSWLENLESVLLNFHFIFYFVFPAHKLRTTCELGDVPESRRPRLIFLHTSFTITLVTIASFDRALAES